MTAIPLTEIESVVDRLFRQKGGQMVSTLTRALGSRNLDLAEAVLQDSLIKALQLWPTQGIPANPGGWIFQVARNQALDGLRRDEFLVDKASDIRSSLDALGEDAFSEAMNAHFHPLLRDDQLRMMFICCHPSLPPESRIALTLKTLCGFGAREIARAFLTPVETVEQRLVRAKRKIREDAIPFEVPAPEHLADRLGSVLEVLYLLFNEGYSASHGEAVVRSELCNEAIRLLSLVVEHPTGNLPQAHALLSLMCLQASRLDARLDADGNILLLEEQDRDLWDRRLIDRGLNHLSLSFCGDNLSDYHLQAGIAATHAIAPSFEKTDWKQILSDYDELFSRHPTPVIALNRAVALMMAEGPAAALSEVERIARLPEMKGYYLVPATLGELYFRLGDLAKARESYESALRLAGTLPERRLLLRKLARATSPSP